jgi:hypothetical protein
MVAISSGFYISKDRDTPWKIAADSRRTEYTKASCESLKKLLDAKASK